MMRNQWRLLLRHHHHLRRISTSSPTITRPLSLLQVTQNPKPLFSLSSPQFQNPNFPRHFSRLIENPKLASIIINIFSKPLNDDEIKTELIAHNVVMNPNLVLDVIANLNDDPKTAIKFFNWVLERESGVMRGKTYNFMIGVLGSNLYVDEFWKMMDLMKEKGVGIRRGAYKVVLDVFEREGLFDEVERLKGVDSRVCPRRKAKGDPVESAVWRIFRIVRREPWNEEIEAELIGLNVRYSSEVVVKVLDKLDHVPRQGYMFFRWVEESGLFKHDQRTYNAIAVFLGKEECMSRFWSVVMEMSNAGFVLEKENYVALLKRFEKRKMMKDLVSLFEVAINWVDKPSRVDCVYLLKKIAVGEELDMELFSRVVEAYTGKGFALDDAMFDAVLKSLTSVGRLGMCNTVFDAMVKCGFKPSAAMQSRVAFDLSSSGFKYEANEFMLKLDEYGMPPDAKTWESVIEGHCLKGSLGAASFCFKNMVERGGASSAAHALDLFVNGLCNTISPLAACHVVLDAVNNKGVIPKHTTYKTLINRLTLNRKGFRKGLSLIGLMKNHGFPPFLDPFIGYLVKLGDSVDAMMFLKSVTVKNFPSTNVFLQVFVAYSMAGKRNKAQRLYDRCPEYIRNNADVLNLFCSMKPGKPAEPVATAA